MEFDFLNGEAYSPLVLAYIGDAVYELYIRSYIVKGGNTPVNKMHKKATSFVKAKAQSDMIEYLMPDLTEEEINIFKRGRNAHSYTSAKNATVIDYRRATGFEALIGYLFITKNEKRLNEIIDLCIDRHNSNS